MTTILPSTVSFFPPTHSETLRAPFLFDSGIVETLPSCIAIALQLRADTLVPAIAAALVRLCEICTPWVLSPPDKPRLPDIGQAVLPAVLPLLTDSVPHEETLMDLVARSVVNGGCRSAVSPRVAL